ncbi:MAG: hypothetical protein QXG55_00670 [Thermoplasmata archaeon]
MILGICYICGKPATHICKLCGRPVCEDHYVPSLGICTTCYSLKKGKRL